MNNGSCLLAMVGMTIALTTAGPASAGIDACGNIRLEGVGSCEIKGSLECTGGCGQVGIYKKACATKLHTVCKDTCTLKAEPTCTDECTVQCSSDCDNGINVICIHNCFGECSGVCDAQCSGAADVGQCMATCEANCDGECDIKCEPVVEASCYQHCVECCGGSCNAQANMDCQTTCQDEKFEDCEYELKVDCEGSCEGDGALFCDGEFILAGTDLPACVQALIAEGVAGLEATVEATVGPDGIDAVGDASAGGCSANPRGKADPAAPLALLAAALGWIARRKRRLGATRS